jgi:hypothetical protein
VVASGSLPGVAEGSLPPGSGKDLAATAEFLTVSSLAMFIGSVALPAAILCGLRFRRTRSLPQRDFKMRPLNEISAATTILPAQPDQTLL